jgi:hypothetical protein
MTANANKAAVGSVALEVYVNGKKETTAGGADVTVLSAIVTWSLRGQPSGAPAELNLNVGGCGGKAELLTWLNRSLIAGDEVRIVARGAVPVDGPMARVTYPAYEEMVEENERRKRRVLGISNDDDNSPGSPSGEVVLEADDGDVRPGVILEGNDGGGRGGGSGGRSRW